MSWITKTWIVRTGRYWLYYTLRLEVGYQPLAVAIIDETLTPGVSSSSVCDITTPRIRFFWAAFLGTLLADFLNFDIISTSGNSGSFRLLFHNGRVDTPCIEWRGRHGPALITHEDNDHHTCIGLKLCFPVHFTNKVDQLDLD